MGLGAIWIVVGLVACGTSDRPSAATTGSGSGSGATVPQTATQAMELVCNAEATVGAADSPERGPVLIAWMRERVTNPEIRRALDELSLDVWPSAKARLVTLATQHGVTACKLADPATRPKLPVDVPELAGPAEPDTDAPLVVVSPTQLSLDGAPIIALDKGRVGPADHERHAAKRLAAALTNVADDVRVRIAFDRTVPVATVTSVIRWVARGDTAKVALSCVQNQEPVLLPVDMPLGPAGAWMAVTAGTDALTLAPWNRGKPGKATVTATLDGGLGQIMRGLAEEMAKGMGSMSKLPVVLIVHPSHDVNRLVGLLGGLRSLSTNVVLSRGLP